jgi:uncharacterized damage-inducible protein DinB
VTEDAPRTPGELDDLVEHLQRYRATTLQVFELIDEAELAWRPGPDQYSLGQQLLHIAQAEDRVAHGLFEGDWSLERVRFPETLPDIESMISFFREVRARLLGHVRALSQADLARSIEAPDSPETYTLRSYLWFILEHELHHRGQIWAYLRAMGKTPPFYAAPLPLGQRPDHEARRRLGGF